MDPILVIVVCVIVGGVLASLGVHLLPVGGAPAAMGTATGIATGTVMLMLGAAMCGLFTASSVAEFSGNILLVSLSGAVGAWIMMGVTMLMANLIYVFGTGIVPASGRVDVDPITKESQKEYKTPQCDGHGVPNVSYISGMMGALVGGFGGAFMYFALLNYANFEATMAGVTAMGIFVANAIIAAYNIGGTIEGFHDPKFKRLPKALVTCFVISLFCGVSVWLAANLGGLL
ncbi:tetrahydromethanopterin S-methyltransferase subunit D [Methanosarcinales archaeon]|nr:MAG: tetrahydromethanopterin S-methyltransferase subunit D [Methanosarcinales archaeon]